MEVKHKRVERPAFQSVVLSGVYDIKNLKLKIRPDEAQQYNSPWNIAAEFDVDMEFSVGDIAGMLSEYEKDYHTGMDISAIAELLYAYTSGYPFLVSRLCKIMDEKIAGTEGYLDKRAVWGRQGVLEAVKQLLSESNTLFDDIRKKLSDYPNMRQLLYELLYGGRGFSYHVYDGEWNIAQMLGYVKDCDGKAMVTNRIFETWLYNLFAAEEQIQSAIYKEGAKHKKAGVREVRFGSKVLVEAVI